MKPERLAALIVGRNLGDAVIQSGIFKQLVQRDYAERYIVWTRPQVAFLFSDIPNCEVITSQFPVGTAKQFGWRAAFQFWRAARQLRKAKPSVTMDLIGDQRERWFARLAGSPRHLHIGWAKGHPFNRIIRNPFGPGRPVMVVAVQDINIYNAYQQLLDYLAPSQHTNAPSSDTPILARQRHDRPLKVGLHPFASQDCKIWPAERWLQLAQQLLQSGAQLTAFGAPSERPQLQKLFEGLEGRMEFYTGSIPAFAAAVQQQDLVIGLDSFAVHMAHRQGVRSIMLNAGNHPLLWGPPDCKVVAHSGGCAAYPCYNIPVCEGTQGQYACISSIQVNQVKKNIFSET